MPCHKSFKRSKGCQFEKSSDQRYPSYTTPTRPPLVHYRAKYKKELKYFNDSSSLNSLFFLITSNADHIGVYGFLNKLRQLTAKARDEKKSSHTQLV